MLNSDISLNTYITMKENDHYEPLIKAFILAERVNMVTFRKLSGLNRTSIEVLVYASINMMFTVYDLQKYFKHTNVQIVRRTVTFLKNKQIIERVGTGYRAQAAVYMITKTGEKLLKQYIAIWEDILKHHI